MKLPRQTALTDHQTAASTTTPWIPCFTLGANTSTGERFSLTMRVSSERFAVARIFIFICSRLAVSKSLPLLAATPAIGVDGACSGELQWVALFDA